MLIPCPTQLSAYRLFVWRSLVPFVDRQVPGFNLEDSARRFNMFGFTGETMDMLLMPMIIGGREGLGSMGNDAPLAVLSHTPRLLFDYFKQLFAQASKIKNYAVYYTWYICFTINSWTYPARQRCCIYHQIRSHRPGSTPPPPPPT